MNPSSSRFKLHHPKASELQVSNLCLLFICGLVFVFLFCLSRARARVRTNIFSMPRFNSPSPPLPHRHHHHHITNHPTHKKERKKRKTKHTPLRPLLIQHPVPTLLAPDRIPLLQLHFGIAVPAQVLRQGGGGAAVCAGAGGGGGRAEEGESGGLGGGGVGFAGHFFFFGWIFVERGLVGGEEGWTVGALNVCVYGWSGKTLYADTAVWKVGG